MISPWKAVVGLGGNIGTDEQIINRFVKAREALAVCGVVRSAPLYRTAPIGPAQQPFLNTAVMVRIDDGTPDEIVAITREIEAQLGRDRRAEERWGPRTIDLDILIWGTRVVRTPHVELPHPRLAERKFALLPLAELVGPGEVLPGSERRFEELLRLVADQIVDEISPSW